MPAEQNGRLLSAVDIRRLAAELELRPTKQLGQNFVLDGNTIRRIVSAARLSPDDVVVEVGPGLGSLTLGILDACAHLTAVEIDARLASRLGRTVAEFRPDAVDRFILVTGDALDVTTLPDPQPTALVANLPYNVAVPVLLTFLERFPTLRTTLVMVQSEVADRLVAPPGSRTYGVPSVKAAWYAAAERAGPVGRRVFWPVPNVDSALVRLTRRDPPPSSVGREAVFAVVDAAFAQRRKTLRAALSTWAGGASRAEQILRAAHVDPTLRGERLTVGDFARIADAEANVSRL